MSYVRVDQEENSKNVVDNNKNIGEQETCTLPSGISCSLFLHHYMLWNISMMKNGKQHVLCVEAKYKSQSNRNKNREIIVSRFNE